MATQFSDSNNILKGLFMILIVVGIAYFIYYLYSSEHYQSEHYQSEINYDNTNNAGMYDQDEEETPQKPPMKVSTSFSGNPTGVKNPVMNKQTYSQPTNTGGVSGGSNMNYYSKDVTDEESRVSSSFPKDQLTADQLLPQDNSSLWAQVNPSGEGSLKDRNFLQSGYHIGINTVGQTLRNANMQLRSEPPCPQVQVSPWIQSTIEPDLGRKPFEIGGCA